MVNIDKEVALMRRMTVNELQRKFAEVHGEQPRGRAKHRAEKQHVLRMEFRTFLNAFLKVPCQIVRSGRKLIYRVLHYNPNLPILFRLATALRC